MHLLLMWQQRGRRREVQALNVLAQEISGKAVTGLNELSGTRFLFTD